MHRDSFQTFFSNLVCLYKIQGLLFITTIAYWVIIKRSDSLELERCHRLTPSLTGRLTLLAISSLFVNRSGCSLQFCHLEFDKKAISDGFMGNSQVFTRGVI